VRVPRATGPHRLVLGAILLLALALRVYAIHNPVLDHPGWRQGDTAAIARNFATLDFNPLHPQTDYDGPPPNYVELELQIVPWCAALLYKIFGVHEVFGRLISIAFSLGTVLVVAAFARWAYASATAEIVAALAFAIYPGSVYYGRTFTPDTTMTFFLAAAAFASARWIEEDDARFGRSFWLAALLTALALLAKPVAAIVLVPIVAGLVAQRGLRGALAAPQTYAFFALAVVPYVLYDDYVRSIAEWHWSSGIMRLHVVPSLVASLHSLGALGLKLRAFAHALRLLATTMLGPLGSVAFLGAIGGTTFARTAQRARVFCWAWLAAALLYAYVVVTIERVDYYLYPILPLAAVWTGGLAEVIRRRVAPASRPLAAGIAALVFTAALVLGEREILPYYHYSKLVYREATALRATLPPHELVVMGHYDPSVLYYIDRKGWEEDAYLWTPFDEESAIAKGARSFIAVEPKRLRRNVELSAWLQRFPLANPAAKWPVYETDPQKILPGAQARWRAFRRAEKAHRLPPPAAAR